MTTWGPQRLIFQQNSGSAGGRCKPAFLELPSIVVEDGKWAMPVPEDELVVLMVEAEGQSFRITSDPTVTSGQTLVVVEAVPLGWGQLNVVDSFSGRHMQRITLLEVTTERPLQGQDIEYEGMTWTIDALDGPERLTPPTPPTWATPIGASLESPITLPLRDMDRDLWVGRQGFQWEKVEWPAGKLADEVRLRPIGSLSIQLTLSSASPGLFDLMVIRDQAAVGSWMAIRRSRTLVLGEAAEGPYRVILRRRQHRIEETLYDETHTIVAGTNATIHLDAPELLAGKPKPGSLKVLVLEAPSSLAKEFDLRLTVTRSAPEGSGLPSFDYPIEALQSVEGARHANFDDVDPGEYVLTIDPCQITHRARVEAGEKTEVLLDLTDLGVLRVWPLIAGDLVEGDEQGRLLWQYTGSDAPDESLDGYCFHCAGPYRNAATWGEGCWEILARPSSVAIVAVGEGGGAISPVSVVPVVEGPNDAVLELSPGGGRSELNVTCRGLEGFSVGEVARGLARSLSLDGVPQSAVVVLTSTQVAQGGEGGLEFKLYLPGPGQYELRQPTVSGYGRAAQAPIELDVLAGRPGTVVLDWVPGGS
jgi:hypothetical protein